MTVGRMSMGRIIMFFVVYLVIHVIIGIMTKKVKEELDSKPGNTELETKYKWVNRLFKWFPAIYVVFILLTL